MYSTRHLAGRLVAIRIRSPFEQSDLKPHYENASRVLAAAPPGKLVFCVDLREATTFTQEVSAALLERMQHDNPRIERSGFMLAGGAVFAMQIERMVRQAALPHRRTFREVGECVRWLSEVLGVEERAALSRFVAS